MTTSVSVKERLVRLQHDADRVRNICILAHIDHGKTTLSDSLLASNGIISSKMAGKVRYLDSRDDEQERGITMKSSAVSLYFSVLRKRADDQTAETREYLINLIDSPGHVDFASEVSTAVRLCDGGLVLVDVVEGVSTQTMSVLRQAWNENVKPCLVLNKIDRLITELRMTPMEAHQHLQNIVERVNAIMGMLFAGDLADESDALPAEDNSKVPLEEREFDWSLEDKDDSEIYFVPERGNVVFASAIDGWAFSLDQFAQIYAEKLGVKEEVLRKTLWGDFYLDPKAKRVVGRAQGHGKLKPMFVQFVLENIWAVYDAVMLNPDTARVEKIVSTLKLKVPPRDLKIKDGKLLVHIVMSQWLPLATAVLLMVVHTLPSPRQAQLARAATILHGAKPDFSYAGAFKSLSTRPEIAAVEEAIAHCRADADAPVTAFVAKMVAVAPESFPSNRRVLLTAEQLRERRAKAKEAAAAGAVAPADGAATLPIEEAQAAAAQNAAPKRDSDVFMGFARVFSGTLRPGQEINVLLPRFKPEDPSEHYHRVTIGRIYLMMGRDLEELEEVPPGNLAAIEGLAETVLKSATLSTTLACPPFGKLHGALTPIVRVALEPTNPLKMPQLVEGLRLLNQADPSVEVIQQDTGEHILVTAGELHLERCMKDLRERFAKISIEQSTPIVPFRETIVLEPTKKHVVAVVGTANKRMHVTVAVRQLPPVIHAFLEKSAEQLKVLQTRAAADKNALYAFHGALEAVFAEAGPEWAALLPRVWSFGPKRAGTCVLVNAIPGYSSGDSGWVSPTSLEWSGKTPMLREVDGEGCHNLAEGDEAMSQTSEDLSQSGLRGAYHGEYDSAIVNGFQLATAAGPLCDEPMAGVCFAIEGVQRADDEQEEHRSFGPTTGQIISATKEACRQAFVIGSPRLMLAVYSCTIQATADVLGKVYGVLSRRRGKILSEVMKEGTSIFNIRATLPVVESFGFADEIRSKTSGLASPQLVFSGWEVYDQDPFWVPTTEEELEDLGEKADRENVARRYMFAVRRRKGLAVDEKIVEHADKQRTLKK